MLIDVMVIDLITRKDVMVTYWITGKDVTNTDSSTAIDNHNAKDRRGDMSVIMASILALLQRPQTIYGLQSTT